MIQKSRLFDFENTTQFIVFDDSRSIEKIRRYKIEKGEQIIFRQKFELSVEKIYYSYNFKSILSVLADVGGFSKFLMTLFGFLAKYFNDRVMVAK